MLPKSLKRPTFYRTSNNPVNMTKGIYKYILSTFVPNECSAIEQANCNK